MPALKIPRANPPDHPILTTFLTPLCHLSQLPWNSPFVAYIHPVLTALLVFAVRQDGFSLGQDDTLPEVALGGTARDSPLLAVADGASVR